MLGTIAERGRALLDLTPYGRNHRDRRETPAQRTTTLVKLCEDLISIRGEASGVALAREILARYADLSPDERTHFFKALARDFGPDLARVTAAITGWETAPSDAAAAELHRA